MVSFIFGGLLLHGPGGDGPVVRVDEALLVDGLIPIAMMLLMVQC